MKNILSHVFVRSVLAIWLVICFQLSPEYNQAINSLQLVPHDLVETKIKIFSFLSSFSGVTKIGCFVITSLAWVLYNKKMLTLVELIVFVILMFTFAVLMSF